MKTSLSKALLGVSALLLCSSALVAPAKPHGDGTGTITGDLKQWQKVTLTLDGPFARESDTDPNPFTDYLMTVRFRHSSGKPDYTVPGYFAADGNAANSSADSGTKWRAHLSPDKPGKWTYLISFAEGRHAAVLEEVPSEPLAPFDGVTGSFTVAVVDTDAAGFLSRGRLEPVGQHYPDPPAAGGDGELPALGGPLQPFDGDPLLSGPTGSRARGFAG
jgi:hypothetical protein